MTRIFVTGATGYIGGDALYTIVKAHPEYEIVALVRNSEKGAIVAAEYSSVKLVYGDLDSIELIEEQAREADIVCRKLFWRSGSDKIDILLPHNSLKFSMPMKSESNY